MQIFGYRLEKPDHLSEYFDPIKHREFQYMLDGIPIIVTEDYIYFVLKYNEDKLNTTLTKIYLKDSLKIITKYIKTGVPEIGIYVL